MGDVNRCEILVTRYHPIHKFLRMLIEEERVDENGVTVAGYQRDSTADPCEIFFTRRDAFRAAPCCRGRLPDLS